jgi:hypothetical protein
MWREDLCAEAGLAGVDDDESVPRRHHCTEARSRVGLVDASLGPAARNGGGHGLPYYRDARCE